VESGTVKTSAIFIATGKTTKVYRTVDEVPLSLRKKLIQSTSGLNSATVLIADRKGAQRLIRAARRGECSEPEKITQKAGRLTLLGRHWATRIILHWTELAVAMLIAVIVWVVLHRLVH
jgi:hypothetical protein